MKRILGRLTYANVMATIAVFIALGGTGYAATQLPKNSVGSQQIKKEAVTPAKLSGSAKAALTGSAGPTGAAGAAGLPGLQGPEGTQGAPGKEGTPGKNLTARTALASGQTETGVFSAFGSGSDSFITGVASFVQPLAAGLDGSHVFLLENSQTNAHCPGPGSAEAGYFCAYTTSEENVSLNGISNPATGGFGANEDGAEIVLTISGSDPAFNYGTWAVTAP
jgi:hypothetical protein